MTAPHYFTNYFDGNVEYVPFYIKTTGTNCFIKGHFEKTDRLLSQEIDIFWGISGTGVISTANSKIVLGKDQVTFCYPREEPCSKRKIGCHRNFSGSQYQWRNLSGRRGGNRESRFRL